MNIYIYGNKTFKNEIHDLLEHANVKFRLSDDSSIIELTNLDDLKNAIEENPEDIYLIDDEKIIRKKSINSKIKFLKPKGGIEEEYLLDHGIGDMSVDSLEQLAKHIIHKLETSANTNAIEEGVEESIRDIVDEAYEEDYEELDDELSSLLSHDEGDNELDNMIGNNTKLEDENLPNNEDYFGDYMNETSEKTSYKDEDTFLDELDNNLNNKLEIKDDLDDDLLSALDEENVKEEDLEDLDELMNLENEKLSSDIEDKKQDNFQEKIDSIKEKTTSNEGEKMSSEFSELDSLNEEDVLSALEGLNDNIAPLNEIPVKKAQEVTSTNNETINVNSSNVNDIAQLIQTLLNNKTLEITIKIKE